MVEKGHFKTHEYYVILVWVINKLYPSTHWKQSPYALQCKQFLIEHFSHEYI